MPARYMRPRRQIHVRGSRRRTSRRFNAPCQIDGAIGAFPLQVAAYNFPSLARANTSSWNLPHAQATDAEVNGIKAPSGEAGQPTDSNLVQALPSHHLCSRSPRWPRAKTSRRVEPPPAQMGGPESGVGTCAAG